MMPDIRDILLSVVAGAFFGLWFGAWAQGKIDERAVKSGYVVHGEQAFQLVPVRRHPTPTTPNARDEG